eukprot:44700_1
MGATCSLLCCGGGCKYLCCWCSGVNVIPEAAHNMNRMIENSKNWNSGDIILERSNDKFSSAVVQAASGSEWTHVGLIYKDTENNVIRMIEICSWNSNDTDGTVPMVGNEKKYPDKKNDKYDIKGLYKKSDPANFIYKIKQECKEESKEENAEWIVVSYEDYKKADESKRMKKYKYEHYMNLEISDHARWCFSDWKWNYSGHRAIDPPLNEEELKLFEAGMNDLEHKEFDELMESYSQVGAGIDCCSCCGFNKCFNEANYETKRLEKLFCAELAGELLQRTGIMKKNDVLVSDEFVPGDFDFGREHDWIENKFKYGKITYYYGG